MRAIIIILACIFLLKLISTGVFSEKVTTVNIPVEYNQAKVTTVNMIHQ